jgi:protoporphyrinogen oxidase
VVEVHHRENRVTSVVTRRGAETASFDVNLLISSMPVRELVLALRPAAPAAVIRAALELKHRDFLTVGLIVRKTHVFPDNWIYIHDPLVKVARIQNYGNWSAEMAPDPATSSLGLEYFCNEGDALWTTSDEDLIALAKKEIQALGFARADEVQAGVVYRMSRAYPLYDPTYRASLDTVRDYLKGFANLETIGRNGLHRYNNQDHSMMTGLLAARNLASGTRTHDVWTVGNDDGYLEEVR